jgi:hypothetical protein
MANLQNVLNKSVFKLLLTPKCASCLEGANEVRCSDLQGWYGVPTYWLCGEPTASRSGRTLEGSDRRMRPKENY